MMPEPSRELYSKILSKRQAKAEFVIDFVKSFVAAWAGTRIANGLPAANYSKDLLVEATSLAEQLWVDVGGMGPRG